MTRFWECIKHWGHKWVRVFSSSCVFVLTLFEAVSSPNSVFTASLLLFLLSFLSRFFPLFSLYFFLHNCGVISVGQGSDHWSSLFSCLWEKVGPPAPRPSSLSEFWHRDESLCRILIREESLTFLQTLLLSQTRLSHLPLPPCCLVPLFQSNHCSGRRK